MNSEDLLIMQLINTLWMSPKKLKFSGFLLGPLSFYSQLLFTGTCAWL